MWRALIFIECLLCAPDAFHLCYLLWNPPNNCDLSSLDPTFLPYYSPLIKTKLGALRSSYSTRIPPSDHFSHFLIACAIVSAQTDYKPHESGCVCLSCWLLYLQPLAWYETCRRLRHYLLMKEWPEKAVACSRIRLAFEIQVFSRK